MWYKFDSVNNNLFSLSLTETKHISVNTWFPINELIFNNYQHKKGKQVNKNATTNTSRTNVYKIYKQQ